ncbi:hypothetical protein PVAP13_8NG156700 [Panicum virgatum]|uniref:Uncharacterized protein n=1 Tax=Panicum virgatum TaxID=38727 RepID=A0A8T0P5T2_PANVG|nr:hypothetical protein PVAP13_8NG156700 [Panicum virgatum]
MWTIRIIIPPPAWSGISPTLPLLLLQKIQAGQPPLSPQPSWWSSPSARCRWQQRWRLVPCRPDLRLEQRCHLLQCPPATTPGATQQPQVSGGVQNPVASSQTAGPNKRLLRRSPHRGEAAAAAGAGAAAA